MAGKDDKPAEDELKLEGAEQDAAAGGGKFTAVRGKRSIIIVAVLLIAALGGGGFWYFKFKYQPSHEQKAEEKGKPGEAQSAGKASNETNHYYEINDLATNMAPSNDKESWIKVSVALQLEDVKDQDVIDKKLPVIKDSILVFLREIRAADLSSSGGTMMLKAELMKRVNKVLYPVKLKDLLFKEILIDA